MKTHLYLGLQPLAGQCVTETYFCSLCDSSCSAVLPMEAIICVTSWKPLKPTKNSNGPLEESQVTNVTLKQVILLCGRKFVY